MSDTVSSLSYDSLPPAKDTDIEEEEIIFVNVEREIEEVTRNKPKTAIGKKSESLLQAVRSMVANGTPIAELNNQFTAMKYTDKQLSGFQAYYKKISEHIKDRISYSNSDLVKKISKFDETSEVRINNLLIQFN